MNLSEKYREVVDKKNSILCIGIDTAEYGQREKNTMPTETDKVNFILNFAERVAPYCSVFKPNRQYIKDLSRKEVQEITEELSNYNVVLIIDDKLTDMGDTNDSGLYHDELEGFDAVTFSPFAGNTEEAAKQAHDRELGLIVLTLMTNPGFEKMKNAIIDGEKGYIHFARQVAQYADGAVIGAPSEKNHITKEEIETVRDIIGNEKFVLSPGIGTQLGEAEALIKTFGDIVTINVSRAIMYSDDPVETAKHYNKLFNDLRK